MFRLEITRLHDFRVFVKIIRGQDLSDEEIKELSQDLGESADKLLAAEEARKRQETT